MKTIGVVLMASSIIDKNRRGEEGEQNTEQRTRDGKPEGNTPAGLLSGWISFHATFSSVRRSTFHKNAKFLRAFNAPDRVAVLAVLVLQTADSYLDATGSKIDTSQNVKVSFATKLGDRRAPVSFKNAGLIGRLGKKNASVRNA